MGLLTAIVAANAVVVAAGLRSRLGLGIAAACGVSAAMLSAGARVELQLREEVLAGCTTSASLEGDRVRALPPVSEPSPTVLAFAMPEPPASLPIDAALVVRWSCGNREAPQELPWRRLSMRWERS